MARLQSLKSKLGGMPNRLQSTATIGTTYGKGRGGRPWARLRAQILKRDRYLCQCEECKETGRPTAANEVDHIVPLAEGGTDDPSNLRAINREHHKAKTRAEAARGVGRVFGR
ncbi:HNH endonuclease signature motif containing protein [Lysobacter sp. Root96]|uniref:HNH endonuclease n=1 Tax=Lysobacter sp. Root96 TaxID=1736612 RepID=UPI0006FDA6E2|nr:HNH endonuclease signature motif containing protein [Lysobacter sp. Root96]KRD71436.1 hypothetical protein ASE45_06400 [Lysobacter sp. Root96]